MSNIEEDIKNYEELKKHKEIIANIDKEFFFNFVEDLISEYKKQYEVNCRINDLLDTTVSKDRIKAKIDELDKEIKQYDEYVKQGIETDLEYYDFIANSLSMKILQELLN